MYIVRSTCSDSNFVLVFKSKESMKIGFFAVWVFRQLPLRHLPRRVFDFFANQFQVRKRFFVHRRQQRGKYAPCQNLDLVACFVCHSTKDKKATCASSTWPHKATRHTSLVAFWFVSHICCASILATQDQFMLNVYGYPVFSFSARRAHRIPRQVRQTFYPTRPVRPPSTVSCQDNTALAQSTHKRFIQHIY